MIIAGSDNEEPDRSLSIRPGLLPMTGSLLEKKGHYDRDDTGGT